MARADARYNAMLDTFDARDAGLINKFDARHFQRVRATELQPTPR